MTLSKLEKSIKKFIPQFNFRQAGYGDVVGCFLGNEYLIRMSKGDVPIYTYRIRPNISKEQEQWERMHNRQADRGVKKRGRMQLLFWMVNRRLLTHRQAQQILWGVYD